MSEEFKRTEHSDILVYWTGRDIDNEEDTGVKKDLRMHEPKELKHRRLPVKPIERPSLIENSSNTKKYLERLRNILKFGLWMKEEKTKEDYCKNAKLKRSSTTDGRVFECTSLAMTCFTELKLSQARHHAYEYGRLGIGVKRMFLFNRAGQPMTYLGPMKKPVDEIKDEIFKPNWFYSHFDEKKDILSALKSFFKYMGEREDHLNYKYYSESEWRIIYSAELKNIADKKFKSFSIENDSRKFNDQFVDVRVIEQELQNEFEKYTKRMREYVALESFKDYVKKKKTDGLKYLLPLDHWLSVIIYPCPSVKILAEQDDEIRCLLKKTREKDIDKYNDLSKKSGDDFKKVLDSLRVGEKYMMPMEIDLDTISHF